MLTVVCFRLISYRMRRRAMGWYGRVGRGGREMGGRGRK